MTCKLVLYYSMTGNTKALVNIFDNTYKIKNINENEDISFDEYDEIHIATSTWGRGIPPQPFFDIRDKLLTIKNKKIGLFGSGNSHYPDFCGALDLIEKLLSSNNQIMYKFKFEGYPKERDKKEFLKLIGGI